jgi:hypothetical protein
MSIHFVYDSVYTAEFAILTGAITPPVRSTRPISSAGQDVIQ